MKTPPRNLAWPILAAAWLALSLPLLGAPAVAGGGLNSALEAAKQQRTGEAARIFVELLRAEPHNPLYLFNYGNLLFLQHEDAGAARAYAAVAGSGSPLALPALLYLAKAQRRLGRRQEARGNLRKLLAHAPPPTLRAMAWEELELLGEGPARQMEGALAAFRAGHLAEAALLLGTLAEERGGSEVFLALGTTQLRLGHISAAREALFRCLEAQPDPETAQSARELLQAMEAGKWESARRFFPEAQLALGYNSNFYQDPSNPSSAPSAKAVLQAGGSASHFLAQSGAFAWMNRYFLGTDGPVASAPERTLGYGAETRALFASRAGLLSLAAGFEQYFANTSPYYLQPSASVALRHSVGKADLGLSYAVFLPRGSSSAYSFLSGTIHEAALRATWSPGRWSAGFGIYYEIQDTGDFLSGTTLLPLRYRGFGPSVFGSYAPNPFWDFRGRASFRHRVYPTSALPGPFERRDDFLVISLEGLRRVGGAWAVFLRAETTFNRSTLGPGSATDENYNQLTALSGLRWRIE